MVKKGRQNNGGNRLGKFDIKLNSTIPAPSPREMPDVWKIRDRRGGHESLAFTQEFIKVSDEQVDLREKYGINLIASHYHIPEKMLRLALDKTVATVLGGSYSYKVYRGTRKVGTLIITVNYSSRQGTEMHFTYKSRKKFR